MITDELLSALSSVRVLLQYLVPKYDYLNPEGKNKLKNEMTIQISFRCFCTRISSLSGIICHNFFDFHLDNVYCELFIYLN